MIGKLGALLMVLVLAGAASAQTSGDVNASQATSSASDQDLWFGKYDGIGFLLSPGIWRSSGGEKGYEVSALYFLSEKGAFSAYGLVFGESYEGRATRFFEVQAGGSGLLLGSLNLGLGRYEVNEQEKVSGYQATLTAHFFIPVFAFVRAKWENETSESGSSAYSRQPAEFGFMLKFPLPVVYNERGTLKFFRL